MPLRSEQPYNSLCVPSKPESAVNVGPACAHPEKINRFLKKNWHMPVIRFGHVLPPEGRLPINYAGA
jgi:hypothetical protein